MSSLTERGEATVAVVRRAAKAIVGSLVLLALVSCGSGGTSAPKIFQQPRDRSAFENQTGYFDVGVEGTTPLTYQWRRNGQPISGATGPTYTTPTLTAADNGARFSIIITNAQGSVTSTEATLTVLPPPTITTSPVSQTVAVGATATFSVTATGDSLTYQWRRDDQPIVGANSATYTTAATTAADGGAVFTVDVANGAGFVTSAPATLTVQAAAAIVNSPFSQTVAVGDSPVFSVTATGGDLTYQWRRNGVDISGATSRTYVAPAVTLADNAATYSVVVTNPRGTATSSAATLTVVAAAASAPPALPAEIVAGRSLTTTEGFVVVRRSNGSLSTWGYNGEGQRGDGTTSAALDTIGTVTLPTGLTATRVAAGGNHALAIMSNGAVYAWGRNVNGQLGVGDLALRAVPTLVTLPRAAVSIAAGRDFSVAVLNDGSVYSWGVNTSGQLGIGTRATVLSSTPVLVTGVTNAASVVAGSDHVLVLRNDGTVVGWGANASGQLGLGDLVVRRSPALLPLSGVAVLRAGGDLSVAITTRRTALAWGENSDSQLGSAGAITVDVPVPTGVFAGAVDAAPADKLLLLVGSDGVVRGAGTNELGSIGDGTTTARTSFTAATGLANILGATAGGRTYALALRNDGSVFAWGDNAAKQLGNSTITSSGTSTPTQVPSFDAIP